MSTTTAARGPPPARLVARITYYFFDLMTANVARSKGEPGSDLDDEGCPHHTHFGNGGGGKIVRTGAKIHRAWNDPGPVTEDAIVANSGKAELSNRIFVSLRMRFGK